MANAEYQVAYVPRSPASMKQEEFASKIQEECSRWTDDGWRLVSAVGDYGTNVTLGTWLYFGKES